MRTTIAKNSSLNARFVHRHKQNYPISPDGWRAISNALQSPQSKLTNRSISENDFDDERAIDFASALVNDTSLEPLSLHRDDLTERGYNYLVDVMCNKSSIESIYDSNHILHVELTDFGRFQTIPDGRLGL